ncbi:hypothetical protein WJX77_009725 [Trebouxia sp. C0004]
MALEPPSPGQLRLKAGTAIATVCVSVALLTHDWEQDLGRDNVMSSVRPAVKSVFNHLFGGNSKPSERP